MNVAILGGSFNPPHICHIFITQYVLATSEVNQIWFLPCYKHAFGKPLTAFHHRLAMCSLAVESFQENRVRVLPLEKERKGTSWTIETVRYLQQQFSDIYFIWIMGSDVLSEIEKWKDFDQLQHMISFVVVPRAGMLNQQHTTSDREIRSTILIELKKQSDELEQQGVVLPNISSSLVRERVKQKRSIHHLVPRKVEEYIYAHGLYQE